MRDQAWVNWTIGKPPPWEGVIVAVLMDIREVVQSIHNILECDECLAIPERLSRIARATESLATLAKVKHKRAVKRKPARRTR